MSGQGESSKQVTTVAIKSEVTTVATQQEYIRLKIITSDMSNEVHFRIKPHSSLGRLKRSYCGKLGLVVDEMRFVYDGHRIHDDDTPNSLNMIDQDVIEIYHTRTGGM